MFEQYNLTSLDTESLENDKIKRYTTERKIYRFGGTALKIKKKLEFYKTFKDEYSTGCFKSLFRFFLRSNFTDY